MNACPTCGSTNVEDRSGTPLGLHANRYRCLSCFETFPGSVPVSADKLEVPDCWQTASAIIGKTDRVLLYGPPATGKTTAAVTLNVEGGNVIVSNFTDGTTEAEIRGHYLPRGSEWPWTDGPGVLAWKRAARWAINEIDHAPVEVHSLLNGLLDDRRVARLYLPDGMGGVIEVSPEDGFTTVATMNGTPDDLPESLLDRFAVRVLIDKPHPDAVQNLPEPLKVPAYTSACSDDPEARITLRRWFAFADLLAKGLPRDVAARAVFEHQASEVIDSLSIDGASF